MRDGLYSSVVGFCAADDFLSIRPSRSHGRALFVLFILSFSSSFPVLFYFAFFFLSFQKENSPQIIPYLSSVPWKRPLCRIWRGNGCVFGNIFGWWVSEVVDKLKRKSQIRCLLVVEMPAVGEISVRVAGVCGTSHWLR